MPSLTVVHTLGDCYVASGDIVTGVFVLTGLINHVTANHPDVVGIHRELLEIEVRMPYVYIVRA